MDVVDVPVDIDTRPEDCELVEDTNLICPELRVLEDPDLTLTSFDPSR